MKIATATGPNTSNVTAGWNSCLQVVYRELDPTLPMSLLVGIQFYKWFTEDRMMMANDNCNCIQHYQCHCWLEFVFTSGLQRAGSNTTNVTAGWNPVLQVVYRRQNDDGK